MRPVSVSVLVPCYKRPEYTAACLKALEAAGPYHQWVRFLLVDDGSNDGTAQLLLNANLNKEVIIRDGNLGLRATLLEFIEWALTFNDGGIVGVVGNDCLMPKDWLDVISTAFASTDAGILSPNVVPSNAAYTYGSDDVEGKGYRPASTVGGLWFMRRELLEGVDFERADVRGIAGAYQVLQRVILEKEPRVGWLETLDVQDVGHWSGDHPLHVKSKAHRAYAAEVGRQVAW